MQKNDNSVKSISIIPYSGKFSRGPIFVIFTDDRLSTKLNLQNKLDCTVHSGHERTQPQKLGLQNGKDQPST